LSGVKRSSNYELAVVSRPETYCVCDRFGGENIFICFGSPEAKYLEYQGFVLEKQGLVFGKPEFVLKNND